MFLLCTRQLIKGCTLTVIHFIGRWIRAPTPGTACSIYSAIHSNWSSFTLFSRNKKGTLGMGPYANCWIYGTFFQYSLSFMRTIHNLCMCTSKNLILTCFVNSFYTIYLRNNWKLIRTNSSFKMSIPLYEFMKLIIVDTSAWMIIYLSTFHSILCSEMVESSV